MSIEKNGLEPLRKPGKLYKSVDGKTVELSAKEEAAMRAEWAENDQTAKETEYAQKRRLAYMSVEEQIDLLAEKGLDALIDYRKSVKRKFPKPVEDKPDPVPNPKPDPVDDGKTPGINPNPKPAPVSSDKVPTKK